jgi:dephospho-CoA kinase
MTKIIGLTGGIGSGKTLVANYIKSKGIPVYIADENAKKIMNLPSVVEAIKNTFGHEVIEDKVVNRKKLSELVFQSPEKLKKLNAIIHPIVKQDFDNWVKQHHNYPFVVKEAAILFESGGHQFCDLIITVTAPLAIRIERVIDRDHTTEEQVLARIKNQWDDEKKIALSHFVIQNITIEDTKNQVDDILKTLKNNQN